MKKLFTKNILTRTKDTYLGASPVIGNTSSILKPSLPAKYVLSAVPNPNPFDRIVVQVTAEGLLLRPDVSNFENGVQVHWGKNGTVNEISKVKLSNVNWAGAVVVHGVVGMVRLFNDAYILLIVTRAPLGYFLDPSSEVFAVKNIWALPMDYQRALKSMTLLKKRFKGAALDISIGVTPSLDTPDENTENKTDPLNQHIKFSPSTDERYAARVQTEISRSPSSPETASGTTTPTGTGNPSLFLAKTLADKLSFWNQKITASAIKRLQPENPQRSEVIESLVAPAPSSVEQRHFELEDKIIREIVRQYEKSGMYFAYNFDLSSSISRKLEVSDKIKKENQLLNDLQVNSPSSPTTPTAQGFKEPHPTLPLWRRVDRRFWWNEHLIGDFIEAGLHCYVLPILQGHFQKVTFSIPVTPPLVTVAEDETLPEELPPEAHTEVQYFIVSRRSRDRAGLRYQRRGVDEDGNAANFVETETVMAVHREETLNLFSFVQIRGSIPLFWSQSGYNLKPPPQLAPERTHEDNSKILRSHLEKSVHRYGPLAIVNLAEQHGKEAALTGEYQNTVAEWDSPDINYIGYDFHAETKGMKYENLSKLVQSLERVFASQGYTWISNSSILSRQHGIYRVNCIDCLDRTNVVQSAFARHVLEHQLNAVALNTDQDLSSMTILFNDAWANNGDAISRAYAGTSALKGDFTRTGKRDINGMLNDGMNSLARMYTSTFSDWFAQSNIDFMLGYRNISVFSEFLHKLSSTEPGEMLRLTKIRLSAIETCSSRVLLDGERLLYGWTLLAPPQLNMKLSDSFEEKVLLLSVVALYIVSYDYQLEKVQMYIRVPLADVIGVQQGAYILSTLEEGSRDADQNFGFTISFSSSGHTTRVTSYSIRNSVDELARSMPPTPSVKSSFDPLMDPPDSAVLSDMLSSMAAISEGNVVNASFKALPLEDTAQYIHQGVDNQVADRMKGISCRETVGRIVECIRQACEDAGCSIRPFIVEKDIVSLAEAQRSTSVYTKLEYGVKRLLWLGR